MKRFKLTRAEKKIEIALVKGEFRDVDPAEFDEIALAVARRQRQALLNIRVSTEDLQNIRQKAKRLGINYQTFISEIIHRFAA